MNRILFRICIFTLFVLTAALGSNWFNQRSEAAKPNCAALAIEAVVLPVGTVNQLYGAALESDGGSGPYTFTKLSGTLPNGVTLNPNGTFGGTPTQPGTFTLTVQTQDANGCSGTQEFTLMINCQTISVTAPANNAGLVNAPFSAQFTQTGGVGTTTFSTASTLPNGVTLAPSGTLGGTPTQTGSFLLLVIATDSNGCTGTTSYLLTINTCQPLSFTVTNTPVTCFGSQNGSLTINAVGGLGALQYSINGGQSFQASNVFNNLSAGAYQIVVKGNALCPVATGTETVAQPAALAIAPSTLPAALAGIPYSQTFNVTGGTGNKTLSLTGTLPSGFSFGNGVLSGTSSQTGAFSFTLTATDQNGCQTTLAYTLQIVYPTISLAPTVLPNGVLGTAYHQSLSATPVGAYSFTLATGQLPPGLTLSNNGTLSGTPTAGGSYTFGIKATGVGSCSGTQSYSLLITGTCATPTLNPATLPNTMVGAVYNQTIMATGGTAPYTFAVTQGALPPGLSLSASTGGLTGTATQNGSFVFRTTATAQSGCTGSRSYVITVACGTFTFAPATLPNGTRGAAYSQQLTINPGGSPGSNATFSLLLGSLPPGFTLSGAGLLSGTTSQAGTYNFTVKAVAGTCQGTKSYALVIVGGTAASAMNGDYDGDGKSDPALWSTKDGVWRIMRSSNQQTVNQSWGTAGDVTLLGDYDGDGKSDLAVFRPADATFYVKRSSDGGSFVKQWGLATDVPVPGDYDGDGKTDIAVWRGATGTWYVVRSSDERYEVQVWGSAASPYQDVPVAGDYDGDGKTDVAVFRRATGTWLINRSSDGQFLVKQWGLGTDVPVAHDYDNDGKMDLAVWRGSNGTWYIWQSATNDYRVTPWGVAGDQARAGDYDGDGKADQAVWRGAEQTWYIKCSAGELVLTKAQGQIGDLPVQIPRR